MIHKYVYNAYYYIKNADIRKIKAQKLTYLTPYALQRIIDTVEEIDSNNVEGMIIEAGCALGGSAIAISKYKKAERPFKVYDVFGMIPPPGNEDGEDVLQRFEVIKSGKSEGIGGAKYYGYEEGLLEKVKQNFRDFNIDLKSQNIEFIQGLFEDTLKVDSPVAFAHLDGDWYSSTMTCLENIVPYLSKGGVLIIDDYNAWSGCRKATDEYFKDKRKLFSFNMIAEKLHVKKL